MSQPDQLFPESAPTATGASGPRASFGQRLVAVIIDGIITGVVGLILVAITNRGVGNLLSLMVGLGYWGYLEGSPSGQTIGKRVMGIRVIDAQSGGPIGFGRALLRYVGRIASTVVCLLGYFWMLWDSEKQTWHDKIATTYVVPVARYPVERWPG